MELERKSIQKQDFSSSRRGYDPAEVDSHLGAIADAVEELKRSGMAGTAADRVKGIIEAAERSAQEIESAARAKAGETGEQLAEAEGRRERAEGEANEQLRRAEEAAGLLEQAVAELERVRSALAALPKAAPSQARSTSRARTAILEEPAAKPAEEPAKKAKEEPAQRATEAQEGAELVGAADPEGEPPPAAASGAERSGPSGARGEPTPAEEAPESPAAAAHAAASAPAGGEGARLIALNMALSGTPREETARYLAENFELDDPDAMLDDVYARAGG